MPLPFEPYRISSIEPLNITTPQERKELLEVAHYNLFLLKSQDIMFDFLTDSGITALSKDQVSALTKGDESYIGSASYERFVESVRGIMPFEHIFPAHQGRGAEHILFLTFADQKGCVAGNGLYGTTKRLAEFFGFSHQDFTSDESKNPAGDTPFKGNMDIEAFKAFLMEKKGGIAFVILGITNNMLGGQPVSLKNIEEVARLCKEAGILLIFDACRFAENAFFIQQNADGMKERSIKSICHEMFSHADGAIMSGKKDALCHIGGWIAVRDEHLALKIKERMMMVEGFYTYGGLAGRDLECLSVGVQEVQDALYLEHRIKQISYLFQGLQEKGFSLFSPPGGHAVLIDPFPLMKNIPDSFLAVLSLNCLFYLETGLRGGCVEICGRHYLRLALPRRTYTNNQLSYIIERSEGVFEKASHFKGLKWKGSKIKGLEVYLSHFELVE